jgi:hypothetical protein
MLHLLMNHQEQDRMFHLPKENIEIFNQKMALYSYLVETSRIS